MFKEPYIETSVTRAIFEMIGVAIELKQNASIIGKPGVGKTSALHAFVEQHKYAYLFTATAVTGNALRDLFREIADLKSRSANQRPKRRACATPPSINLT